jgi:hypothetical protein
MSVINLRRTHMHRPSGAKWVVVSVCNAMAGSKRTYRHGIYSAPPYTRRFYEEGREGAKESNDTEITRIIFKIYCFFLNYGLENVDLKF